MKKVESRNERENPGSDLKATFKKSWEPSQSELLCANERHEKEVDF